MADDYDFFDTPREKDAHAKESEENRPRNPTPSAGNNNTPLHSKPPAHPNSLKKKNDDRNNHDTSDSSDSDDDSSTPPNSSDRSKGGSEKKKVIEAKVPSIGKSSDEGSSNSDDDTLESFSEEEKKDSARKSKTGTKDSSHSEGKGNSSKNSRQAVAAKDVKKYDKNQANKKTHIDVRLHMSDTESSDADSDVTNVSPLNTPHPAKSAPTLKSKKRVTVSDLDELPISDLNELLQTVLDMDRESESMNDPRRYPSATCNPRNYSFSKNTVR